MPPSTRTYHEYLEEALQKNPDRIMFREKEEAFTVSEISERINKYGCWLEERGLDRGDVLGLRMTKTVDTICFLIAAVSLGGIVYLADEHENQESFFKEENLGEPLGFLSEEEGRWCLYQKKEEHFFCGEDREGSPIPIVHSVAGEAGSAGLKPDFLTDAMAPAVLIKTSGSSGSAKLVALSQYNVINNLTDAAFFGDYQPEDIALGMLPLSHIFGILLLTGAFVLGYQIVFPENLRVETLLECMEKNQVSRMNCVPSLYLALAVKAGEYDLSKLRVGFIGGAPFTEEEFYRIENGLGIRLIPAYGMSECPSISIHQAKEDVKIRKQGMGRSYYYTQIRIKDDAGRQLGPGQEGEICVKSATLMLGYYSKGSYLLETDEEGFFHTGDLGYLDDEDKLFITGRMKEIIIRNGNNISLRKIEEALLSIPGVEDAAAFGRADEVCGEVPVAAVCSKCKEDEIFEKLGELLVKNELPVCLLYYEELPRTHSGKVDKQALIRDVLE